MFNLVRSRRGTRKQSQKPDFNLAGDAEATLQRCTGNKKIKMIAKSRAKSDCSNRVVSWIDASKFSVDISLFSVLHKPIVSALIKKQKAGIRCRVIIYRHLMEGFKRVKNLKYLRSLLEADVEVRWATAAVVPLRVYRIFLIDCLNASPSFQGCFMYGEQSKYAGTYQIANDLNDLTLMKCPTKNVAPWQARFEQMWSAIDADEMDNVSVESAPQGFANSASTKPLSY